MALHLALARVHGSSMRGDWFCAAVSSPIIAGANRAVRTKKGRVLPISEDDAGATTAHADELFQAIRREATKRRGSVKLFMNWTGASERSAKAWLGGSSLPRADHLIALMASSDEIFEAVLRMTGRGTTVLAQDLAAAPSHLAQATAIVDRLVTGSSSPQNERRG